MGAALCALALQAQASTPSGMVPPASETSGTVQQFAQDVVRSADAEGRTFGVIDKPSATLWIFDAQGRPVASSPVLVGQAVGDVAPPDIGMRPLSKVKLHEKVTNAGRFVTEAGSNHKGEDIVWLDYNAALSMHRVRNVPGESRTKRLQTPTVADNRISFGCVNIPASFYDRYIDPLFSRSRGWSTYCRKPNPSPACSRLPMAACLRRLWHSKSPPHAERLAQANF
ncbi:L,D-transpeptidase [Ottowia beijingensis]|uniref:L,D-transpeptidase n=1 Tax=Ottowia beijingensis TaxID=1207057 RepID=A0A853IQX7_9BURK|nr:L,D-transpeptidase [Ottowia beijingensis]NZA02632.1 L,D-transpeptidase [Ottowia beijingensis]